MLRIFRVDHKNELTIQDPRLMYIDVTKDTNIKQEYIKKKVPKIRDTTFPLYLENYVLWNENELIMKSIKNDDEITVAESELYKAFYGYYETRDVPVVVFYLNDEELEFLKSKNKARNIRGLIMKSIKNDDELEVEEPEISKAFYGYYETRDVPVVVFYLNEEELEFLKSKNKARNIRYEFFDENEPGAGTSRWLLFPGRIDMGYHYVSTYGLIMQDIEEEPRMFYFTENDRLFCGTRSMSISTIEVKDILDCPQSQYDISEKVYNFDTHRDRAMYASKIDTEFLAKHLGVPLKFLDQTFMPE
ncbi:hypothetical protein K6H10_005680 [Candida tropicalis]